MRFLIFNIAVIGALFYLLGAETSDLSRVTQRIHAAAERARTLAATADGLYYLGPGWAKGVERVGGARGHLRRGLAVHDRGGAGGVPGADASRDERRRQPTTQRQAPPARPTAPRGRKPPHRPRRARRIQPHRRQPHRRQPHRRQPSQRGRDPRTPPDRRMPHHGRRRARPARRTAAGPRRLNARSRRRPPPGPARRATPRPVPRMPGRVRGRRPTLRPGQAPPPGIVPGHRAPRARPRHRLPTA